MKTKIIYISGNEVFDMTEVRAAFEEVRTALGLGKDTILFGVPVDSDNALADINSTEQSASIMPELPTATIDDTPIESVTNESEIEIIESAQDTPIETQEKELDLVCETQLPESEPEIAHDQDAIIPILSVLSVKEEFINTPAETERAEVENAEPIPSVINSEAETESVAEPIVKEHDTVEVTEEEPVISSISIDSELIAPVTDDDTVATTVSISDMINDDAPTAPVEKTLEQLLESMTPLREDMSVAESNSNEINSDSAEDFDNFIDVDTDATLAQLASEFVETGDAISVPKKNESHGKIGKLKNILPFKKAKRDDSGLIGDLFGWAGIAANDDDFSIPGFFTKKQGA